MFRCIRAENIPEKIHFSFASVSRFSWENKQKNPEKTPDITGWIRKEQRQKHPACRCSSDFYCSRSKGTAEDSQRFNCMGAEQTVPTSSGQTFHVLGHRRSQPSQQGFAPLAELSAGEAHPTRICVPWGVICFPQYGISWHWLFLQPRLN